MRSILISLALQTLLLSVGSCTAGSKSSPVAEQQCLDTLTSRANLLTIIDRRNYTEVLIHDPWSKNGLLAHLALVPRDSDKYAGIPGECTALHVPLERSVVYSSVHTSPLFELGAGDAITAVADGNYFAPTDTVSRLLSSGLIADIGSSASPSIERILALEAEAVLLSPMQNSDNGALKRSGISVIPMADYMEQTPLARAEWIKLLGELYGKRQLADSVYNAVCSEYTRIARNAQKYDCPRVLTENITSGVWYVPGGKSYMARMLADAGADYPWSGNENEGSLTLDASAVLDQASDADIWLIRCFGATPTLASIEKDNPVASHIKAFKNKSVYVCNTSKSNIFNDIAFHPERVLRDFVIIFHPEALRDNETRYYKKI